MSLTRPSWVTNTIQSLANRVQGQGTALKQNFDKLASDTKTYTTNLCDEIETQFTSKSEITNNRKLSAMGDFTGTWNGVPMTSAEPGLSSAFNAYKTHNAVDVKDYGAKGDGVTDDTASIQAALNYVESIGGGNVLIPSSTADYMISDTIRIGSNTTLIFQGKSYLKLSTYTSVGTVIFNKLGATNIDIINPLINGNNISAGGENGISCGDCGSMHVIGGHIKNCVLNPDPAGPKSGGKAFQVESYNVGDFWANGTLIENCSKALSSVRDLSHVGKVNVRFDNIHAKNCNQFSIFTQQNGTDALGLEHEIMVTNFIAENCGSTDGVFIFSRTHNCHFINGRIINASKVDSIIRGRHSRCTFDNIDILGNCSSAIDLNPSYFGLSTDVAQENKYDFKVFGTYDYLLKSDTTGTTYINNALLASEINALLVNDAVIGLVESHAASQTTIMKIMNASGKRIINSTTNVYFLTNTFALAPKLKMEYHTLDNLNMAINMPIKDSASALNVGANGLTYAMRLYDADLKWNMRFKPAAFSTIEILTETNTQAPLTMFASSYDLMIGATSKLAVRSGAVSPGDDNVTSCGGASVRWSQLYAGTATISTSDERVKTEITEINEAVLRVWSKVNFTQFKFTDSVNEKGKEARIHFGLIAQQVKEAFESEGLDPFAYGLLCYDEWPDEYKDILDEKGNPTGEKQLIIKAGNRYGIRYEEALALECAYLRSRLNA